MLIARIQDLVRRVAGPLAWLPPAVARLMLGVTFTLDGWGKLHNLDDVIQAFKEWGIPAASIQAPMVAGIQLVGGALLLLGLATRLAAFLLMCTMAVAILTAKWPSVHGIDDLLGLQEFDYLTLFLWLAVAGAGALSLDHLVGRRAAK